MSKQYLDKNGLTYLWDKLKAYFQQKLVSGTNIKTINNQSLLGSGNISISGGGGGSTVLDFYPVGSYYETSDTAFDPNTAWGGTWVLETAGQFHVSAGTGYAAGSTGGSADAIVPYHRHSVAKVTDAITGGAHTHDIANRSVYSGSSNYTALFKGGTGTSKNAALSETHTHDLPTHNTEYAGTSGNTTGANMPPYIAVNRWHRTA